MSDNDDGHGVSPEERRACAVLFAAVWTFSRARKRMTLSHMTTFINIATEQGLTVSELATRCGMNGDVISKHLRELGAINRRHGTGLGWVTVVQQVHGDRRERRVILTHRGYTFARKVIDAMNRAHPK
jgi:DNA-binding MarR family transcriptional regulator